MTTNRARHPALVAVLTTAAAAVSAALLFQRFAPVYLIGQGFPLDDAWIHAVYARELATTATMAYNPGVPATGETSPAWAFALALAYRSFGPGGFVLAAKLLGLTLWAASICILTAAVARGKALPRWRTHAAVLPVIVQPDLLAAAVSGMEVSLACFVASWMVWAVAADRPVAFACASALAVLTRPELGVFGLVFAVVRIGRCRELPLAWCAGTVLACLGAGVRNVYVSGLWLPATFHAKVARPAPGQVLAQLDLGWRELVGTLAGTGSWVTPALGICAAGWLAMRRLRSRSDDQSDGGVIGADAFVASCAFISMSFVLIPPLDPSVFYHQRYVLPGIGVLLVATPFVLERAVGTLRPNLGRLTWWAVLVASVVVSLAAIPTRLQRLSSDARNIDEVQVRMGQALETASPGEVLWAVDAGAVRYFGRAFVVDMIGLNTPELLGSGATTYLARHLPSFLDVFPGWSSVRVGVTPTVREFVTNPPYTVTSNPGMDRHLLVSCPEGERFAYQVRGRLFELKCASSQLGAAVQK